VKCKADLDIFSFLKVKNFIRAFTHCDHKVKAVCGWREVEAPRQATQDHYFVTTEHGLKAAKGGKGTAQGFAWDTPWLNSLEVNERNKIKILLRLEERCAIISLEIRLINELGFLGPMEVHNAAFL
jgi:hypothetical protein